jgi:signal transduction histidine kinase
MGRALTRGIELREDEVLELIRSQVSKLMNADNLYIALYDEATDTVRFGLAFVDGRRMDVESAEGWQPRRMGKGRTEWIIHHRRPILISTRAEGEAWYKQPGCDEHVVGDVAPSWLGVPMMMGDKVLGVIATYHPTWSYMYSEDDLDILQTMASQAAVAIENARLYADMELRVEERTRQLREAQEKALAAEVNAKVGLVAAEVAHHTKNLAGIIRCCAIRFQQQLQSLTLQQQEDLNNILLNSEGILKAAEDLFRPFGPEPEAKVSVDLMLREALDVLGKLRDINIRVNLAPDLPRVTVQVQKVTSYITELLNNAVRFTRKRMKERGIDREQIEVDGWLAEDGFIELTFTNHGPAIPREHWEEIFKLFSAREGEAQAPRSYGLGLWGARTTMRAHGGDVCILESNEERSTFLLRLPTQQQEG